MRVTRLALVAIVLVTAGCGQAVTGSPVPNPEEARKAAERLYNESVSAISTYVTKTNSFRGTIFFYAAVNERKSGSDIDVAMRGAPGESFSLLTKSRSKTPPGYDYDIYHPAGDPLEYVMLGKAYTAIAATPWVSMPATGDGFACAITGLQTLCKVTDALDATEKAAPPGRSTTGTRLPDGSTEVRTEITLKAFVDNRVINIPADVVAMIEPSMMGRLVPLKVVVQGDGTLRRVEVKGEVQGAKSKVQLEVGFEAHGPADVTDFPPLPPTGEVTALPDKAAKDDFWKRMATVQN